MILFWVLCAWGAPSPESLDVTPWVHALSQDDLVHEAEEVQALWDEHCAQGVVWACHGPPDTLKEAAERWSLCEPDAPIACLISGWSAIERSDRDLALSSLGKACSAGLDRACIDRSFVALGMPRSPSDPHPALFLGTACGQGAAHACKALGVAHRFGVGVPMVLNEALRRFDRACELGDPSSCTAAVEVHLLQGEESVDRERDLPRVQHACAEGDPFGCKLALPWAPRDAALAQRACALGVAEGCLQAANIRPRAEREERQQAYAAACRLGLASGCVAFASAKLEGPKRVRDAEQARQVLLTTCEGGEPAACLILGMEHLPGGRLERQADFALGCLEKACAQELAAGCLEAAWAHRRGFAGTRELALAEAFEARACDLGMVQGCPGP